MPALSSARLGSGGVSIGVQFDVNAGIAQLRQAVAAQEKNLKAKPKVEWDFQEAAVTRGVRAVINKIQREAASIDVAFRLKDAGLLDAAKRAGALSANQLAALATSTPRGTPLRSAFAGVEADARNLVADQLRKMRDAASMANATAMAREMMFGPQVAHVGQGFSPRNFDSSVGLQNARFGASDGRVGQFAGLSDVAMTPAMRARASLAAAQKEHQARMDLEAKFAKESPDPWKGVDDLGKVGPGGWHNKPVGSLRPAVGVAAAIALFVREAAQGAVAGNTIERGIRLSSGSSDPMLQLQGRMEQARGAEAIPVISGLIAAFNDLTGVTRNLKVQIEARASIEARAVSTAQFMGDPLEASAAANDQVIREKRRAYDTIRLDPTADPDAKKAAYKDLYEARGFANLSNAWAAANRDAQRRSLQGAGTTALLNAQLKPMAAESVAFDIEQRNALDTAMPWEFLFMKDKFTGMRQAKDIRQARVSETAGFDAATIAGASQMRIYNKGLSLEDESAFNLVRQVQRNIALSSTDKRFDKNGREIESFDMLAKMEGLSALRGAKAGLMVRGGGVVGATNLATDLVGDPLNLMPETQARLRAGIALDKGLKDLGEESAPQLPDVMSKYVPNFARNFADINLKARSVMGERAQDLSFNRADDRQTDAMSNLTKAIEKLSDDFGNGKVILLPN